uniref:Cyclin N-terminal domain-containing protein n=1 Tax=Caenorhabditis tropicalis TaxID=1561998 RepID=A0A1I7T847_9PELO
MAGRKSSRTSNRLAAQKERKSAILSPHDELRERLLETAIDVKENIPERRVSSRNESVGSQTSECSESRKRYSTEKGPAAKRHSNEKRQNGRYEDISSGDFSEEREAGSSSSSGSARTRGRPLPAMPEEEEEVFDGSSDHLAESEESHEMAKSDDQISNEDEIDEDDDEENDDEEEEEYRDSSDGNNYSDISGSDKEGEEDDGDIFEEEDDEDYENETEDEEDLPVQNEEFAVTKRLMNDPHLISAPSLLSNAKCAGIGSPTKVWSLMVKRDDIPRATRFLLENHPEMTVSMRCLLVDWMMEVCESEELHRETFHLAVDYVDRFLESSIEECSRVTFQLVGTAALFIAAKYEEIYPPKCDDFAKLTDGAFSCENIREMEVLIVKAIGWSLSPITSIQWLSTYLQLLGTGKKEKDENFEENNMYVPEFLRSEYIEMCKVLDYLLFEIDSFNYTYRTIAAAVLFVNYEPTSAVEQATGFMYEHEQLQKVIDYVRPVCRVFSEHARNHGDVIPDFQSTKPDDAHNIQVHLKRDEMEKLVKIEREKDRQRRGLQQLL